MSEPARHDDLQPRPPADAPQTATRAVPEEFVALLAHELRTPLALVGAAASLALEGVDPGEDPGQHELLETIRRNNELAVLLLERLRLARDLEAGNVKLSLGTVDLDELVRQAVDDLRHLVLSEHPVDVRSYPRRADVEADATTVREIMFNLLSNAAKYSDAGAPIEVTLDSRPEAVHVTVRNHGSGVTPGDTEAIFEKYFQAEERNSGTGLGLFIARSLARAHGGDLIVQPAAEIGSEFLLTLPREIPGPTTGADVDGQPAW